MRLNYERLRTYALLREEVLMHVQSQPADAGGPVPMDIGAVTKDLTFSSIPFQDASGTVQYLPWYEPIRYAIWLIPTCIFGSWFGAKLTHRLPLKTIRIIFICILHIINDRLVGDRSELEDNK